MIFFVIGLLVIWDWLKTVLSNYVWGIKNEGKDFTVNWSILKRAKGYESGAKQRNLCFQEKLSIMKADKKNLLNKRIGIFSTCRHRKKFLINKIKTPWRTTMRSPNHFYLTTYETVHKRMTKSESGQLSDDHLKRRETLSNN